MLNVDHLNLLMIRFLVIHCCYIHLRGMNNMKGSLAGTY